jgi:hypothetical protein
VEGYSSNVEIGELLKAFMKELLLTICKGERIVSWIKKNTTGNKMTAYAKSRL